MLKSHWLSILAIVFLDKNFVDIVASGNGWQSSYPIIFLSTYFHHKLLGSAVRIFLFHSALLRAMSFVIVTKTTSFFKTTIHVHLGLPLSLSCSFNYYIIALSYQSIYCLHCYLRRFFHLALCGRYLQLPMNRLIFYPLF